MALNRNPKIIFCGDPLPEELRAVLTSSGRYTPEMVRLLMLGLPVSSGTETASVIEYPDGRRIQVRQHNEFDHAHVSVKLAAPIDAGAMSSLKIALIAELLGKPAVGPGVVVAGTVSTTRGRVVSAVTPVVNCQT